MSVNVLALLVAALLLQSGAAPPAPSPPNGLDYDVFKSQIQSVFLAKRPGNARCYSCHRGSGGGPAYLQPLSPGASGWTDEQSRKNFAAVSRFVTPGAPEKSRLLMHPLAEEAGGDEFHAGGKHWTSRENPEWQLLANWVKGQSGGADRAAPANPQAARANQHAAAANQEAAAANHQETHVNGHAPDANRHAASAHGAVRIVQTNSAGDSVDIIDPSTNKVVGEIKDIEVNHGAAAAPDGSRLYITNEADSTLDIVDAKAFRVAKRIPLTGHPNNLSISRDGRRIYVAIAQALGAVDIVDAPSQTRVKTIPIEGSGHNTFVTPDGKHVIAGSVAGKTLTVIDTATEEPIWTMRFEGGVRPIAFEKNADGSTARMFVQISDLHGFAVVDFATHREVSRVVLPDPPGVAKNTVGVQGSPSHGIAVAPDGKTLWATSKWYHFVAAFSLPDLKPLGIVPVGHDPDWLTFTPDSRRVYVACAGSNVVSVVDVASMKELTRIPVGQVPKRNITAVLH